jgi:hypothetical protein
MEPSKGFVFKAFDKYKEKFFINIVKHPLIDKPEEKDLVDYDVFFVLILIINLIELNWYKNSYEYGKNKRRS